MASGGPSEDGRQFEEQADLILNQAAAYAAAQVGWNEEEVRSLEDMPAEEIHEFVGIVVQDVRDQLATNPEREGIRGAIFEVIDTGGSPVMDDLVGRLKGEVFDFEVYVERLRARSQKKPDRAYRDLVKGSEYLLPHASAEDIFALLKELVESSKNGRCIQHLTEAAQAVRRAFSPAQVEELKADALKEFRESEKKLKFNTGLYELFGEEAADRVLAEASEVMIYDEKGFDALVSIKGDEALMQVENLELPGYSYWVTNRVLALVPAHTEWALAALKTHKCVHSGTARLIAETITAKLPADETPALLARVFEDGFYAISDTIQDEESKFDRQGFLKSYIDRSLAAVGTDEREDDYSWGIAPLEVATGIFSPEEFAAVLEKISIAIESPESKFWKYFSFKNLWEYGAKKHGPAIVKLAVEKDAIGQLPVDAVRVALASDLPNKKKVVKSWWTASRYGRDSEGFWELVMSLDSDLSYEEKMGFYLQYNIGFPFYWEYLADDVSEEDFPVHFARVYASPAMQYIPDRRRFLEKMPCDGKKRERAKKYVFFFVKEDKHLANDIFAKGSPELKRLTFEVFLELEEFEKRGVGGTEPIRVRGWTATLGSIGDAYFDGTIGEVSVDDAVKILRNPRHGLRNPFCYDVLNKSRDTAERRKFIEELFEELASEAGGSNLELAVFEQRFDWYLNLVLGSDRARDKNVYARNQFATLLAPEGQFEKFERIMDLFLGTPDSSQLADVWGSVGLPSGMTPDNIDRAYELVLYYDELGEVLLAFEVFQAEAILAGHPELREPFIDLAKKGGGKAVISARNFQRIYTGKDDALNKFEAVKTAILKLKDKGGEDLLRELDRCPRLALTIEVFLYLVDIISTGNKDLLSHFVVNNHLVYSSDLSRFKIGEVLFNKHGQQPQSAVAGFIEHATNEGLEAAEAGFENYLEALPRLKQKAVSANTDDELRASPYYKSVLEAVYGKSSNYTDIDRNLQSGDSPENLERYSLPKDGVISFQPMRVEGYRIKKGREERPEALEDYQKRVHAVAQRAMAHADEKEKLEEEFESRVNTLFDLTVMKDHVEDLGLNVKEKLLVVMLDQELKRQHRNELLDLLVLHKFVYERDITEFVNQTAERVKSEINEVSQRFRSWVELSEIYGENLKHTLEHEVVPGVSEARASEISEIYMGLVLARENLSVDAKQEKRIRGLIDNPRIAREKLPRAIEGNLVGYFGRGLSETAQKDLLPKLRDASTAFFEERDLETLSFEDLEPLIKDFALMAAKVKYDPNTRIGELAKLDQGKIEQEIAKYEEHVVPDDSASTIEGVFSMTKEAANARMTAHICIGEDPEMYKNPNYFQFVLKDQESGECLGLIMFLAVENADGKKYLFFAPNPTSDCLNRYSEKQIFNYLKGVTIGFAKANGFDGVVIPNEDVAGQPKIYGGSTNRGGKFLDLLKKSRIKTAEGFKAVDFDEKAWLSQGRFKYGYDSGVLIWERSKKAR